MVRGRALLVGVFAIVLAIGVGGGQPAKASIESVEPINVVDDDGDGILSGFDVAITADTDCVGCFDEPNDDPNIEPYFKVFLVDEEGTEVELDSSDEVENSGEVNYTYTIDTTTLERFDAQRLEVRVELLDRDTLFDDEVDEQSIVVDYEPPAETNTGDSETETETETGQVERLFADSYSTTAVATAVSANGSTIAYGQREGDILLYDASGESTRLSGLTERSVTNIHLSDENERLAAAWIDGDTYGSMSYDGSGSWSAELPGVWTIDATADADTTAAVSSPIVGPGTVSVTSAGEVLWEKPLVESVGSDVAITDNGSHVAVGAGGYYANETASNPTGTSGVIFYTNQGERLWIHETTSDVITIEVDAERELIYAGLNEGGIRVLDFDGEVVWEDSESLGLAVSSDGSTVVTATLDGIAAFDGRTGEPRWQTNLTDSVFSEEISVSENGSRVLVGTGGNVSLIENGQVVWNNTYDDVAAIRTALADDGSTWSVVAQHGDASVTVEAYRDHNTTTTPVTRSTTTSTLTTTTPATTASPTTTSTTPPTTTTPTTTTSPTTTSTTPPPTTTSTAPSTTTTSTRLSVSVHEDAQGAEYENLDDEYVTLTNNVDTAVDLSAWTIQDNDGHAYTVPGEVTLASGESITLYTGKGTDADGVLYWGQEAPVWNNDGDTVIVIDSTGAEVLRHEY